METHTNNPLPTSPFLDVHLGPQCSQFLRAACLLSFLDLLCSSFRLLPRCPSACTLLRQVLLDWPLCWLSHCLGSALSWHWGRLEFQPVFFWQVHCSFPPKYNLCITRTRTPPSVVVTVVHHCYRSPKDMSDLEWSFMMSLLNKCQSILPSSHSSGSIMLMRL